MSEGIEKAVDTLYYNAELRSRVLEAATDAVKRFIFLHGMTEKHEEEAAKAVRHALEENTTARGSEDLRHVAEEAIEASFKRFGFDDAKILGDLYVFLDEEMKAQFQSQEL